MEPRQPRTGASRRKHNTKLTMTQGAGAPARNHPPDCAGLMLHPSTSMVCVAPAQLLACASEAGGLFGSGFSVGGSMATTPTLPSSASCTWAALATPHNIFNYAYSLHILLTCFLLNLLPLLKNQMEPSKKPVRVCSHVRTKRRQQRAQQ